MPNNESASSASSDEDFSASEEEWLPSKKNKSTKSSDETDSDFEESDSNLRKRKKDMTSHNTSVKSTRKKIYSRLSLSLATNRKCSNPKNQKTFHNSTNITKSSQKTPKNCQDSDSSGDDHLVDPNEIDFSSSFFAIPNTSNINAVSHKKTDFFPQNLSDGDEDDNLTNKSTTNFDKFKKFNKLLAEAQNCCETASKSNVLTPENEAVNITQLLAIGEGENGNRNSGQYEKQMCPDSDTEWEEVEEKQMEKIENIEIVTKRPTIMNVKKNHRLLYFLYALKTAVNRKKREAQLAAHKVNILCLIAHGNYVNEVLNIKALHRICKEANLNFPKKTGKKQLTRNYIETLIKWFRSTFSLNYKEIWSKLSKLPALPVSLGLQIQSKAAICKRDYVLLFILILRAFGINARFVMNLVTVPIRPLMNELCHIDIPEWLHETSYKFTFVEATGEMRYQSDGEVVNDNSNNNQTGSNKNKSKKQINSSACETTDTIKINKTIKKGTKRKSSENRIETRSPKHIKLRSEVMKKVTKTIPLSEIKTKLNPQKSNDENRDIITLTDSTIRKCTKPLKVQIVPYSNLQLPPEPKTQMTKTNKRNLRTKQNDQIPKKPKISIKRDNNEGASNINLPNREKRRVSFAKIDENVNAALPKICRRSPRLKSTFNIRLPRTNSKKSKGKSLQLEQLDGVTEDFSSSSDSDFEVTSSKNRSKRTKKIVPPKNKKVKTFARNKDEKHMKDDQVKRKKNSVDYWIEIWCETEKLWFSIDLFKEIIDSVDEIRKNTSKPMRYIFAWNSDKTIKDVSARYCKNWNLTTRMYRVQQEWLNDTLNPYKSQLIQTTEDSELDKLNCKAHLPKVISEYKNHPLFALERHLLKFEVIYPPDALTLGYIRSEPVFSRDCVHVCHSRESWFKQARVILTGEKPYKVVRDRPKWDSKTRTLTKNLRLEIFGHWQTEPYEPPTARDGIVPRNAYGNVELFQPEMLPKGTVHLTLPGLNRTCKRLGIDCANAFVGWNFHRNENTGKIPSPFDGYVICEEFKNQVIRQWEHDQKEAKQKEEVKRNERIYGNWKKLIKGLLIRQRLQRKYAL